MDNFIIIIGLFAFHYLADFTHLSTPWMLKAKYLGKPLFPIFCHALVHALLMCGFLYFYTNINTLINLFLLQLITHFIIDTLKGNINYFFPNVTDNKKPVHWYVFGFDQLLHNIVIVIMYLMVIRK